VSGFKFKVYVEDNGEPGKNDVFKISLSNGYSAGGTLLNGNIQIHKGVTIDLRSLRLESK
jgi:hypothetical protein